MAMLWVVLDLFTQHEPVHVGHPGIEAIISGKGLPAFLAQRREASASGPPATRSGVRTWRRRPGSSFSYLCLPAISKS